MDKEPTEQQAWPVLGGETITTEGGVTHRSICTTEELRAESMREPTLNDVLPHLAGYRGGENLPDPVSPFSIGSSVDALKEPEGGL